MVPDIDTRRIIWSAAALDKGCRDNWRQLFARLTKAYLQRLTKHERDLNREKREGTKVSHSSVLPVDFGYTKKENHLT
jgi:hypothetical protein